MSARKAQEEIVGFVVVVVLIAVVALVFLSFSLRKGVQTRESVSLSHFVESLGEYTTSCSLYAAPDYASIGELYRACYQQARCSDETDTCLVLNQTLGPLIRESLHVGDERPLKGYAFSVSFVESDSVSEPEIERPLLRLAEGNCSSRQQRGASDFRHAPGGIIRAHITTCA